MGRYSFVYLSLPNYSWAIQLRRWKWVIGACLHTYQSFLTKHCVRNNYFELGRAPLIFIKVNDIISATLYVKLGLRTIWVMDQMIINEEKSVEVK